MATTVKNTISDVLAKQRGDVNRFIEEELPKINGLRCEIIEIASDVGLAIDNVRNAWDYAGLLTELADDVDAVAKQKLQEIETIIADLKTKNPFTLVNLSARARSLIESLILKGWQPKVVGLGSRYVWIQDGVFQIPVSGRYKYSKSYPDTCSLDIPGYHIFREKVEEGRVMFKATRHLSNESAVSPFCHFVKGSLEVKYNAAYTSFTTYLKTAKFELWIGIFPLRLPTMALTTQVVTPTIERRHMVVSIIKQRSITKGPETIILENPFKPTAGWRIASKSRKIQIAGTTTELPIEDGKEAISVVIEEGKDKVEAQVMFDEERDVNQEENKTEQLQLKWGEMRVFKATKFKVALDFHGKHYECEQPAESDYFKVVSIDPETYYLMSVHPLLK